MSVTTYPLVLRQILQAESRQQEPAVLEELETNELQVKVKSPWLVAKYVDLLFVCGIAPWLLGAIAYLVVGDHLANKPVPSSSQQMLSLFYIVASLLIGEAHQFTSLIRFWKKRSNYKLKLTESQKLWAIGLSIVALGVSMLFSVSVSGSGSGSGSVFNGIFILTASGLAMTAGAALFMFPVVLMQHICGQAKAIGLIYCSKSGYKLSKTQHFLLTSINWLLVLAGATSIALPFGKIASPETLAPYGDTAFQWSLVLELVFALSLIKRGMSSNQWLPLGATLIWSNLALFVLAGSLRQMMYVWLFVPVFYHATQHWAISWHTEQKESGKTNISAGDWKKNIADILRWFIPIQALTLAVLFVPVYFVRTDSISASSAPGLTLPLSLSMFVFYLHYFADRVVWRPQTPKEGSNAITK